MLINCNNYAIQIPGGCSYKCLWCSTGIANTQGNITRAAKGAVPAITRRIEELKITEGDHVHITGAGEPGQSKWYKQIVRILNDKGVLVSVCCGGPLSIPGPNDDFSIFRADVSCNEFTDWQDTISKAKDNGIIVAATKVDADGSLKDISPREIAEEFGTDAALIRALRIIGLAANCKPSGKTRWWATTDIPHFPTAAFPEFKDVAGTEPVICIDHSGNIVDYLGLPEKKLDLLDPEL